MTYYAQYDKRNGELSKAQCKCLSDFMENIEISKDVYDNLERYIYINGEIIENPDYDSELLAQTKTEKLQETLQGARDYINNDAVYRYDENNTIEATDGNIGKLTAYALALQSGLTESVSWTSKEDNVLNLNAGQITQILTGLGQVQAYVWNVQYIAYKQAIESATTLEELNAIEVKYTS